MKAILIFSVFSLCLTIVYATETLEDFVKDEQPRDRCFKKFENFLASLGYR